MASIPIVSDLIDVINVLPQALKELPSNQTKARSRILETVTNLAEAVSQALNVVTVKCGKIVLQKNDLKTFKHDLVELPNLLKDFRLNGVCKSLGKVRAELRTILNMKRLSLRLFQRKKLEKLLNEIQQKERDLEEDFDFFFRDLSRRAPTLKRANVPEITQYLKDCQLQFEEDARVLRKSVRTVENSL